MKKIIITLCSFFIIIPIVLFAQNSGYKISGTVNIGGKGWWDYASIDEPMQRLYISHADRIHVINLKTNKFVGEIDGLSGVHGEVFDDALGKGFISNGRSDTVTVFNLKTLKKIAEIHVTGKNPDGIVYDPFSQRVFTINGRSSNITAIDAKTDKIVGTIPLEGSPEFCVTNGKGSMFLNIEDKNQVVEFNPNTLKIVKEWSITPGKGPAGLAIDIKHDILFSGCRNNLMVISNAKTGKVITSLQIGGHVDACRFDPKTNFAFSSNGEGTLTVIHEVSPKEFKVIDNVATQQGCRTMEIDLKNHNIYLPGMLEEKNNAKSFGVLILERN